MIRRITGGNGEVRLADGRFVLNPELFVLSDGLDWVNRDCGEFCGNVVGVSGGVPGFFSSALRGGAS